jgi:hypothetical protein
MQNNGKAIKAWAWFKDWFKGSGWIDLLFGVVAALLMPKLLPITVKDLNELFWGVAFFLITEFAQHVFRLPHRLKKDWDRFQEKSLEPISKALSLSLRSHTEWCLFRYNLRVIQSQQSQRGSALFKNRKVEEYVELIKEILSG